MIVVFGSINLDLIFPLPHLPSAGETVLGPDMRIEPGGKGANQAVAAARDGAAVVFAGAVGTDALAADALLLLQEAGVDLSRVARAPVATGCAAICVDRDGRNQIAVASGANLAARQAQVEDALLGASSTLLLQMETDAAETAALIRRARAARARVVLNLAPASDLPGDALAAVDVLVANEEEAAWLGARLGRAATADALHAALGIAVVVTRGGEGVTAASREGSVTLPAHPVTAVDTTAAGDCFTGVLAATLDRGAG
ncbi:MAG: ribokinase, partial [Acetobacteraceae bacterium]|nr:ribokinase [Acetobacteraceae bacterium]